MIDCQKNLYKTRQKRYNVSVSVCVIISAGAPICGRPRPVKPALSGTERRDAYGSDSSDREGPPRLLPGGAPRRSRSGEAPPVWRTARSAAKNAGGKGGGCPRPRAERADQSADLRLFLILSDFFAGVKVLAFTDFRGIPEAETAPDRIPAQVFLTDCARHRDACGVQPPADAISYIDTGAAGRTAPEQVGEL